jgi:RHS repeat-associated protein
VYDEARCKVKRLGEAKNILRALSPIHSRQRNYDPICCYTYTMPMHGGISSQVAMSNAVVRHATSSTRYVHPDHLGSTNVVTDASGAIAQLLDYYPYGTTRVSSTTFPTNENRQYIGQFSDLQTNLSYLNARYYEGSRGQFLSEDPTFWKLPKQLLADPQQFNSYSYGRGNPIAMKDPTGESSIYSWGTDPYSSLFYTGSLGSVAALSQATGLPATAMLLSHSLSLNPGPIYAGNDSVLTNAITSNSLYQNSLQKLLNDASARGDTSITNAQLPLNFKQGDAATSFGKIDIYINATKDKNGAWQVSGQGSDVYDFQYMPYKNKVFSTINNTAYFGQNQGTVSNFTTYVNFTQTISPSQTFTTPSGAVVRWDGILVSGPPKKK